MLPIRMRYGAVLGFIFGEKRTEGLLASFSRGKVVEKKAGSNRECVKNLCSVWSLK